MLITYINLMNANASLMKFAMCIYEVKIFLEYDNNSLHEKRILAYHLIVFFIKWLAKKV